MPLAIPNDLIAQLATAEPTGAHTAATTFVVGVGDPNAPAMVGMFALVGNLVALEELRRILALAIRGSNVDDDRQAWFKLGLTLQQAVDALTKTLANPALSDQMAAQARGDLPPEMFAPEGTVPTPRPPLPGVTAPPILS